MDELCRKKPLILTQRLYSSKIYGYENVVKYGNPKFSRAHP